MGGEPAAALLGLWLLACGGSQPEPAPRSADHFGTFDALVDAAVAGALDDAQREARDLVAEADTMNSPGVESLGGAVGFVLAAREPADLVDGLVALSSACGTCHREAGVPPSPEPSHDHREAAHLAAWSLVWGRPLTAPVPKALEVVYPQGAAAVLGSCGTCHPQGRGLRRSVQPVPEIQR